MGLTRLEEFAKAAMQGLLAGNPMYGIDELSEDALSHALSLEEAIDAHNMKHPPGPTPVGNSSDADPQAQGHDAP